MIFLLEYYICLVYSLHWFLICKFDLYHITVSNSSEGNYVELTYSMLAKLLLHASIQSPREIFVPFSFGFHIVTITIWHLISYAVIICHLACNFHHVVRFCIYSSSQV